MNSLDLDALFAKVAWPSKTEECEKCIEILEIIIKRGPFHRGIWMLKAKIHSQLGNEEMARPCQKRGEEQSGWSISFDFGKERNIVSENHYWVMRNKRDGLEDILKLLRTCQKRLEKDLGDVDAWFSKGVTLAWLEKYKQAIYCLNQVTRIEMNYPSVWRLKATVYALMGSQRMSGRCKEVAERLQSQEDINSSEGVPATQVSQSVTVYRGGGPFPRLSSCPP